MLAKRIIPCLDVKDGRVVKGVNFVNLRDAGDPVELAALYDREGADEIVFLDISASNEGRATMIEVVRQTAGEIAIPFTVGGGISQVEDMKRILRAGAVAAIEAGEAITRVLHREIFVELDYTWLGKVENELRSRGIRTGTTAFADKVTLLCLPLNAETETFRNWMIDLTQGQAVLTEGDKVYFIEGE